MAVNMEMLKELRARTEAGFMDCKKALEETNGDMEAAVDWLRKKGAAKANKKAGRTAAEGRVVACADGNTALIVEMNCETDFAANNKHFVELVEKTVANLMEKRPATLEAALEGGVSELINNATAVINEKITLRRFEFVEKTDEQAFGLYTHMNNQIASIVLVEPANAEVAQNMAMQVASMAPEYVSQNDIPAAEVEHEKEVQRDIMAQDPANAKKPANILEKMLEGKVSKAFREKCLMDQEFFLDTSSKVQAYLKANNTSVVKFSRYKVGEGIAKAVVDYAAEVAEAANAFK